MAEAPKYEIPKAYEPGKIEKKWYKFWLEQGYFTPKIEPGKKPFVIIMPPPNVTGELHLGHALTATLEDVMVRWHRMRGEPTLWLPGTDHAGIATQVIVEQQLEKKSLTRKEIGREKFLQAAWEWANSSRKNINLQHQMLGASCDWSRERFTLDEGPTRAVYTSFVNLYNQGLIYRGERIINWCPRCQTALSDLEAEHREIEGYLYYLRYPLAEGSGFITVATTRPETFFGDTAVAVNPQDERYQGLVGKMVVLPIIDKPIPVIADDAVDRDFGTGALKITPAHDPTDFEVGQRHNLPLVDIMNPDATLNEHAGPYAGEERFACRDRVVSDFRAQGLLEKIEPYLYSAGHCIRCRTVVEPRVSLQWFVRTRALAEKAIEAVRKGDITIVPERFSKVYFEWMENIRDWCISRQLWWGHRIPVWYCPECAELTVSVDTPSRCSHCGSSRITRDPDVLDTWFSSALWTHSTLGWPEDTEDLRYFYPGSVMETGYDILFFWVARMIMMGLVNTGKIPFRTVYLHGLIRDEHGEKMSKLRGNVINPARAINEYGVDALRFALASYSTPGSDINLGKGKLEESRNFINKLWNAARFIFQGLDAGAPGQARVKEKPRLLEDRWIVSRLNRLIGEVNTLMETFQFGEACRRIYDFVWSEFCDWYVEIAKLRLRDGGSAPSPLPFLADTLESSLRLLHPFMPFITEELWQNVKRRLPRESPMPDSIMLASYPAPDESAVDTEAERTMEAVIELIRSIRNVRAQYKVEAARRIEALVYTDELLPGISSQAKAIETLARVSPLAIAPRKGRKKGGEGEAVVLVLKESEVVLPRAGLVDRAAEERRLTKESEETRARIAQLEARLKDRSFLTRAPQAVVDKERSRLAELKDRLKRIEAELSQLSR